MKNVKLDGELSDVSDDEVQLDTPHITRQEIQKILGMRPRNLDHYRRALVHKSIQRNVRRARNGSPDKTKSKEKILDYLLMSNERLEYLGDSVLGLIVANYLFDKFPNKDEGFMTRTKTKLVCGTNCAKFAQELGLGEHILMSKHVIKINGQKNIKLLEDAFEAFIGAVYKDLGFKFAQVFVCRLIDKHIDFNDLLRDNNYKDMLLRYSQSKYSSVPTYEIIGEEGPPHKKLFTVIVTLNNKRYEKGVAKSKKAAEQLSAKATLDKFNNNELDGIINRDK
jgi:ribonuclease III